MTTATNPELLDITCSDGACLKEALVMGHVTLRAEPQPGVIPDEQDHTFALPLCVDHAHLLRAGATLVEFHCGP